MRKQRNDPDYEPEGSTIEAGFLLTYLWEVGPTIVHGEHAVVVSFQDIAAWQLLAGVDLEPWHAKFLRRLSGEYLAESVMARDRMRPEPVHVSSERRVNLADIAKRVQRAVRNLAGI